MQDGALIEISGGSILDDVDAQQAGVIRIRGAGFNRPVGVIADNAGTIIGTLEDGSPINTSFFRTPSATIELVPEPAATASAALALLALGALRRLSRPSAAAS